jgi:hypothetical protein
LRAFAENHGIRREISFMKTGLIGIVGGLLLGGISLAQEAAAPPAGSTAPQNQQMPQTQSSPADVPRIAPGSVIPVQLTKTIDAKKVKTGDQVEAKVTQDLKTNNGELIVPKDTRVMGHVTEAQARNKEQKESQVGIAFDHAVMKNGNDVPLPMSIQAIIAPTNPNGNSDTQASSASGGMPPSNNQSNNTGRGAGSPGMSAGSPPQQPSTPSPAGGQAPSASKPAANQPITEKTQGVIGMSNLQLSAAPNTTEGSVVTSEKNNVKLDSGTLMLLRVNP